MKSCCFGLAMYLAGFFACVSPASAEIRALLVGVSDYPEETGISDLRGPRNDVSLLRDVLERRGVDDIRVLADGVEGAVRPTRAAIGQALAALPDNMGTGDLVIIHFSGHGTRQGDANGDESDGLDEVFLPADIARAEPGAIEIPNALSDDAIGAAVAAVRATGADVWLIMDSCHSGSGIRNASSRTAVRQVDPAFLGLSIEASAAIDTRDLLDAPVSATRGAETEGAGGFLAFYATRSSDVAREADLGDGTWYGLFSATLAARLESLSGLSYRQLFQAVLNDLNENERFGSAALQTPQWEGNLGEAPVFGGSVSVGLRRFLVDADQIEAGLVHQMQNGTLVALVADIGDPPDKVLGYAQIEDVEARRAYLRPVAADCMPDSSALCAFEGALPAEATFAQVESHPVNGNIRFSPVLSPDTGLPLPPDHPAAARFDAALRLAVDATGIAAVIDDTGYEAQTVYDGQNYWFGPQARAGSYPVGLSSAADTPEDLSPRLQRILRAETLVRILNRLKAGESLMNTMPLQLDVSLLPSSAAALSLPGQPIDAHRECRAAIGRADPDGLRPLGTSEDLKQCDQLAFAAAGLKPGARDVNRIRIDAQYCIHTDYALIEGDATQQPVGDGLVVCSDCPSEPAYSAGAERLFFLVAEVEEHTEALNMKNLLENCTAARDTDARSMRETETERSSLMSELGRVGERGVTRGGMSVGGTFSQVWVRSYDWRVIPRELVFDRLGQ
ncbi:MAG: caspase family protein [Tateyamaria sp.]|uniref:caspase family protein n=1 Tax=Tateyamaria sp. TaxID=1929288 RepID=UPI00329F00B0